MLNNKSRLLKYLFLEIRNNNLFGASCHSYSSTSNSEKQPVCYGVVTTLSFQCLDEFEGSIFILLQIVYMSLMLP